MNLEELFGQSNIYMYVHVFYKLISRKDTEQ